MFALRVGDRRRSLLAGGSSSGEAAACTISGACRLSTIDAPLRGSRTGALPICGAIFEAARPHEELTRLEARAAAPDFWKDQAEAQKVLQRRRRLEQDRELIASLKKKSDDLARARRMGRGGRSRRRRVRAGARRARPGSPGRRDQEDARRRARSQERDRHDPSGRRRHRVAGLGRNAAAHVPAVDGAARLQARD